MPNKCCVPKCTSGYDGKPSIARLSLHSFPLDESSKGAWLRAIPRDSNGTWAPSKYSRVCSLHFHEDDFVYESADHKRKYRSYGVGDNKLQKRYLKPGAVPSIFPNLPKYLSSVKSQRPTSRATSSARISKENEDIVEAQQSLFLKDSVIDFSDLCLKCEDEKFPTNVHWRRTEDSIQFYCLSELCSDFVEIEFSVMINRDLTFNLYYKNVNLDRSCVNHLTTNRKITSVSLLQNILSHMKSIPFPPMKDMINHLINEVESIVENLYPSDIDSHKRKKLIFIREQLALINSTPKQKQYSPVLLATSLLWHNTSPALYRQLSQDGLTLPSLSHLRKWSSAFTMNVGFSSSPVDYLSVRLKLIVTQSKEGYSNG